MFLEGKIIIYIEKVDSFNAKTVVSLLKWFQINPRKIAGLQQDLNPSVNTDHTLAPALPMYGSHCSVYAEATGSNFVKVPNLFFGLIL